MTDKHCHVLWVEVQTGASLLGDQFACSSQNVSFHFLELLIQIYLQMFTKICVVGRVWMFMVALFIIPTTTGKLEASKGLSKEK